jgi:hypothetical protein
MFIPEPLKWPKLAPLLGRIIMLKGPALPFSHLYHKLYHCQGKVGCDLAKKEHEKTKGDIETDVSHQVEYHIIGFDSDIALDNSIFSQNNFNVTWYENGMKMEKDNIDVHNEFDRKINFMATWWQIAVAGGTCIRANPASQKVDAGVLLD